MSRMQPFMMILMQNWINKEEKVPNHILLKILILQTKNPLSLTGRLFRSITIMSADEQVVQLIWWQMRINKSFPFFFYKTNTLNYLISSIKCTRLDTVSPSKGRRYPFIHRWIFGSDIHISLGKDTLPFKSSIFSNFFQFNPFLFLIWLLEISFFQRRKN